MTGRHAIRSGTHSVSFGAHVGLVAWEQAIGDILSDRSNHQPAYRPPGT